MGTRLISPTRLCLVLVLAVTATACTTVSSPGASTGGGGSSAGPSTSTGGGPAASGGLSVDGSLTTSGIYNATWGWTPDLAADIGDLGGITVSSDKGTFGNITVMRDGSIRFGSGAAELSAGSDFTGSGASVSLGTGPVEGGYVCSFTLDNDLTGSDGSTLHIKGTMAFHSDDTITPC
jgi:hypothetical protein